MISNRRGSSVSNDDNDIDGDGENDVIAWDFDTSFPEAGLMLGESGTSTMIEDTWNEATTRNRPMMRNTPPSSSTMGVGHPLEQLFNDGTVRSNSTPPTIFRPRKDTMPSSRPVSPLPPLTL